LNFLPALLFTRSHPAIYCCTDKSISFGIQRLE
jgi:hypothetical protein